MDASSRRPQLPALSYLEIDKPKREDEAYQSRNTNGTPTPNGGYVASPVHQYPSGPPPPYTHSASQHANSWPGAKPSVHTPPDSRRTSGDEHENTKQTSRQLLPSISEALGPLDSQTPFPPATSVHEPLPPPAAQIPTPHSGAPRSPLSASRRSYPMEPPPSQNHSQYSIFRQDSAGPPTFPPSDPAKASYAPPPDARPPIQASSTHQGPPSQSTAPYSDTISPRFEQQSSSSMPPPPPTFPYGYTPYPPRYAQSSQTPTSGPIYQPSAQFAAPPPPTPAWKQEGSTRYSDERSPSAPYGESVKRHLDLYDLEASLNEVSSTSGGVLDFARRYGNSMHQSARSGTSISNLPGIVEIEDMIHKSRIQLDSLSKIREVVLAQQAAYEQQMADQRHKAFAEPPPPSAAPRDDDEDIKGGFAGSETKKRRGRAAPPGRCHSCNRAETPEWRRGPDGARTLCNACGLHYAKLTRKQTNAKGANVGSSNLRPKEA